MTRSELDTIEHVLRGAFNTILLNLQLVSTGLEDHEEARPLVDRASSELRRVATVVLPAALRIMSLEVTAHRVIDLAPLLQAARVAHGLPDAPAGPGAAVKGDPALLASAIDQLVANAVAATPLGAPRPDVTIESSVDGAPVVVVRNTCGDPAPTLTAEGTPPARGHLGGVVAVIRIARLHGGTLTYERQGLELIARLSLPAAAGHDGVADRLGAASVGAEGGDPVAPAARRRGAPR